MTHIIRHTGYRENQDRYPEAGFRSGAVKKKAENRREAAGADRKKRKEAEDQTERMEACIMERAYKTMTSAGGGNIALGIIMVVTGITAGVITIVNGARLLRHRKEITF